MPSFLLAVKHAELDRHNAELLVRIARETGASMPQTARGATAAGDWRSLRGLPAIGRGVRGAIPGTTPHDLHNLR